VRSGAVHQGDEETGVMPATKLLLIGASFSRNWGAPLANEVASALMRTVEDVRLCEFGVRYAADSIRQTRAQIML
jgi:hypothetical protein